MRGTSRASYKAHLAVLSFEAGLNTLVFASEKYDDLESVDEERICRLAQRVTHSVLALSPSVDNADWSYLAMPWQTNFGPTKAGEWATRNAFFDFVESLRLPYRLTLHCRANVDAGDFAIEFDATRWQTLPLSAYVAEIGLVGTTPIMRKREAADYNARVALLLAACAFSSNIRIRRVWIQATTNDPKHHACLLSATIDRRDFTSAHIGTSTDAIEALAAFGARIARRGCIARATKDRPRAATINVQAIPDLVPPLAALAATCPGTTTLSGAARLRLKESDRLETVSAAINALGGHATIDDDTLLIEGTEQLTGGTIDAAGDHRIAMMGAIMATHAREDVTILGAHCVEKSYPTFWEDYARLGGRVHLT